MSGLAKHSNNPASPEIVRRLYTVCVIGVSGTEREKGLSGVGKSCLCNRFVRPSEDDYHSEHLCNVSQVDFGGRVINNDHWLYWGDRSVVADEGGGEVMFRVIEQTEFVDDESFQPMKGNSSKEAYAKRAAATKLQSPDKLMYICKEQLGVEQEFEQVVLPEGRVTVDGFICVFDVSLVPSRPVEHQADQVAQILTSALKSKRPVVCVTTKNDERNEACMKQLDRLLNRREFKGVISCVDCSAHQALNVDAGFLLLAHLVDRTRAKPKLISFADAQRSRQETLEVARAALRQKMRMHVNDHRMSWNALTRLLREDHDFRHFCDLFGQVQARRMFQQFQTELRERAMQQRAQGHLQRLPQIFAELVPDASMLQQRSWDSFLKENIISSPNFNHYFLPFGTVERAIEPGSESSKVVEDSRIPAEVLHSPDAELVFRNYVNSQEANRRRDKMHEEFYHLLKNSTQVTAGKPLEEVKIFLMGKEQFESLSSEDINAIYDQYQRQLVKRAKRDFTELLLENVEEFSSRVLFRDQPSSTSSLSGYGTGGGHSLVGITDDDMHSLHAKLQEDVRYRQMSRLYQARDAMINQYISFVAYPLRQHCPAFPRCVDQHVEQIILNKVVCRSNPASSQRAKEQGNAGSNPWLLEPPSGSLLNLVLLGANSLAAHLLREMRVYVPNDEFVCDNQMYSLAYRLVDGTPNSSQMAFRTPNFAPNGLVCVYSSRTSLDFVRDVLSKTILTVHQNLLKIQRTNGAGEGAFLPLVLLLACDPANFDDLPYLQQQGSKLAESLCCPFVGVSPTQNGLKTQDRRGIAPGLFSEDQVLKTLQETLINCVRFKAAAATLNFLPSGGPIVEVERSLSQHSSFRIQMCLLCGDDFSPMLLLNPLLDHLSSSAIATSRSATLPPDASMSPLDASTNPNAAGQIHSFVVETLLPSVGHKVRIEVSVAAYHTAFALLGSGVYYPGYVLVYSTKRRASLAHLDSFAQMVQDPIPLLLVAVGEVTEFFSDLSTNALITEGNDIADKLNARFITVSKASEQQVGLFTPFFEEVLARMPDLEKAGLLNEPNMSQLFDGKDSSFSTRHNASTGSLPGKDNGHYASLLDYKSGAWDSSQQDVTTVNDHDSRSAPLSEQSILHSRSSSSGGEHLLKPSMLKQARSLQQQDVFGIMSQSFPNPIYESNNPGSARSSALITTQHSVGGPETGFHGTLSVTGLHGNDAASDSDLLHGGGLNNPMSLGAAAEAGPSSFIAADCGSDDCLIRGGIGASPSGLAPMKAHRFALSETNLWPATGYLSRLRSTLSGWLDSNGSHSERRTPDGNTSSGMVKPKKSAKPGKLNLQQFSNVNDALGRPDGRQRVPQVSPAPLATPESIEEARAEGHVEELHYAASNVYETNAPKPTPRRGKRTEFYLPPDGTTSSGGEADSSSLECRKTSSYDRMGRKPTPHKSPHKRRGDKRKPVAVTVADRLPMLNDEYTTAEQQQQQDITPRAAFSVATNAPLPPVPPYSRERLFPGKVKLSLSCESLDHMGAHAVATGTRTVHLDDSLVGTGHGLNDVSPGLMRRVASSFRFRSKKRADSKSMPHSPNMGRHALALSPSSDNPATFGFVHAPSYQNGGSPWLPQDVDENDGQAQHKLGVIKSGLSKTSPKKDEKQRKTSRTEPKKTSMDKCGLVAPGARQKKKSSSSGPGTGLLPVAGQMCTLQELAPSRQDPVPLFVRKCVSFIEAEGLNSEGIYRVPGNQAHVALLEQRFIEDPNVTFQSLDLPVNAVATALKNFFSNLSEPVVPHNMYEDLMQAMSLSEQQRLGRLRDTLFRLPHENRELLKFFIVHLRKVAHHAHETAMDHRNLAKCWWPTLLRPHFDNFETMAQMTQRLEDFVQLLLDQYEFLMLSNESATKAGIRL